MIRAVEGFNAFCKALAAPPLLSGLSYSYPFGISFGSYTDVRMILYSSPCFSTCTRASIPFCGFRRGLNRSFRQSKNSYTSAGGFLISFHSGLSTCSE